MFVCVCVCVCVFLIDAKTAQPIVFKLGMGKEGHLVGKIGLFYDRRFTGGYVRDNGRGDTGGVEVRGGGGIPGRSRDYC